ncbi:MAG TPA: winged helix DNA-binding domain-containing protein [Pseudonocardiaceae bacterium]|nr:winged helix DNA-binding domain-containing protein [Pseudonocardiaceae bacterium]
MPKPLTGPEIDLAAVRAHALAKQGLTGAGLPSVLAAVERTAGVYGSAPTPYLSLSARIPAFRIGDLDAELYERRSLVRVRCMHEMVYVVAVDRVGTLTAATAPGDKAVARILRVSGMSTAELAELSDRIEAALADTPPATVAELRERLGKDTLRDPGHLPYTVALMARQLRLVRTRPRGSWRSDGFGYARWADWVAQPLELPEPERARVELARYYLRAFGPATAADLKWWAGWTVRDTTAALAALEAELAPVRIGGQQAWVLGAELSALSGAEMEPGVRLLPVWDTYSMGYADRARIAGPVEHHRVFDKVGNATSMLLVDGEAAGLWELDDDGRGGPVTVRVAPFRRLDKARWGQVDAAAGRIATALDASNLRIDRVSAPANLDTAGKVFLNPITLGGRHG